jgi:hypothetical protein
MSRITPSKITSLASNEVFVFGSNLVGIHGAGAARDARAFGAIWGQGEGPQGQCYALPTKRSPHESLTLEEVNEAVQRFIEYADQHHDKQFLITRLGCGRAGFLDIEIAPMFAQYVNMPNLSFPLEWGMILHRQLASA